MQDTSADIILHNNKVQNKGNKRKVFIVIIVILLIVIIVALIRNIVISNTESNSDLVKEIASCDAVNERDLENAKNGNFLMFVDSVSSGKNDEVIVTGCVRRGSISLNDEVEVLGLNYENVTAVVSGINNEGLDYAEVGDTVDVVLDGVESGDIDVGQVVVMIGSMKVVSKFEADVYVLSTEEGGRRTPFFSNYRPQFYFRTLDVTGGIVLLEGVDQVNPGDDVKMTVELVAPVAIEKGTEFLVREGGRTIGRGVVTKVYL